MLCDILLMTVCQIDWSYTLMTLQDVFTRDSLNHLWNEMMKDGELVPMPQKTCDNDELPNCTGAVARRGNCLFLICRLLAMALTS